MSNKEAALAKMSKYLLSGAKMERDNCPDCNIPLLRDHENNVFCANCGRKVVYASEAEAEQLEKDYYSKEFGNQVFTQVEAILFGKLEYLANQIATTTEDNLAEFLQLIDQILTIIERLKRVKAIKP